MIKVQSFYSKEKLNDLSKSSTGKSLIASFALAAVMIAFGVYNLVSGIRGSKMLEIILGATMFAAAALPIVSAVKNRKQAKKEETSTETKDMAIDYIFKEKRAEITIKKGDTVTNTTLMYKYITKVERRKTAVFIYVNTGTTYYIEEKDIVEGTLDGLLKLFRDQEVLVKNK